MYLETWLVSGTRLQPDVLVVVVVVVVVVIVVVVYFLRQIADKLCV